MKRKINVIGKVCRILATILLVFSCIGTGAMLLTGLVMVALPQDGVAADVTGTAQVVLYGKWIADVPDEYIRESNKAIAEDSDLLTINGNAAAKVEKQGDTIVVSADAGESQFTFRRLGLALLVGSLGTGTLIYVFIMLVKLMKELSVCESPFTDGVVRRMTGFAISLIPYAIVKPAAESIAGAFFTAGNYEIGLNLDLTTVFTALVIFLLIFIFKYGVSLQKEADETL